jgi:DNA-binding MarR family transcriptional regulator
MTGTADEKFQAHDGWQGRAEVGAAFIEADRNLRRLRGRDSQLPPGHLGHSRFELLDILREIQPTSARDLARAAGFTAPTISRMLEALEADDFVFRAKSQSDGRIATVALTGRGLDLVEARREFWGERWLESLAGVDAAELASAAKVLRRIAAVFGDPDADVPQPGSRGIPSTSSNGTRADPAVPTSSGDRRG